MISSGSYNGGSSPRELLPALFSSLSLRFLRERKKLETQREDEMGVARRAEWTRARRVCFQGWNVWERRGLRNKVYAFMYGLEEEEAAAGLWYIFCSFFAEGIIDEGVQIK